MNMTAAHLNAFIEGTSETLDSMCGLKLRRVGGIRKVNGEIVDTDELMAIIGLSGCVKGCALISSPLDVGLRIIGKFMMSELTEVNSDLMDGFGELVNIIAGAADAKFEDIRIDLSLPTILIGGNTKFFAKAGSSLVMVPFVLEGDGGRFCLGVSMDILRKKGAPAKK